MKNHGGNVLEYFFLDMGPVSSHVGTDIAYWAAFLHYKC